MSKQTRVLFCFLNSTLQSKEEDLVHGGKGQTGLVVGDSAESTGPTPWRLLWPGLDEVVTEMLCYNAKLSAGID